MKTPKEMAAEVAAMGRLSPSLVICQITKRVSEHLYDDEPGLALGAIQELQSVDQAAYQRVKEIVEFGSGIWKGVVAVHK